eukprot:snap_masked-scaffold364_size194629-processed-gene-0.14 protein:Tk12400 transcript:snap_masked-scaffold364_size194629-processed-gene-0.14-mRNA-1 annotation:"Arfaptin-2"
MARSGVPRSEFQEIMDHEDCEEMEPGSDSVISGGSGSYAKVGRTTPPNSLAIMPDHIFGCDTNGPDSDASSRGKSSSIEYRTNDPVGLESPSKVLGGSTSWTATSNVSLSSPSPGVGPNGTPRSSANRLEYLKNWTISTYKCSRQSLYEKLGKTNRTVDTELEGQIETLRDTQRKYSNILRLARALTSHFYHVVQTQSALGEAFGDLANRSPELQEEFLYNADTQRSLVKNGEQLIGALNFFVSSVNTLCHKTMEDTIATVKQYETARVEYDAYRADMDFYASAPKTEVNQVKQKETLDIFQKQKQEFEKLRSDVQIKLKFLDENRVKVMHKQLLLFHNAISAYFSGGVDSYSLNSYPSSSTLLVVE